MKRIQLDLSEKTYKSLENLKKLANLLTNSVIIRNALAIYTWVFEVQKNGEEILVQTKDGEVDLVEFFHAPKFHISRMTIYGGKDSIYVVVRFEGMKVSLVGAFSSREKAMKFIKKNNENWDTDPFWDELGIEYGDGKTFGLKYCIQEVPFSI